MATNTKKTKHSTTDSNVEEKKLVKPTTSSHQEKEKAETQKHVAQLKVETVAVESNAKHVVKKEEISSENSSKKIKALSFLFGTTTAVIVALWLVLSTVVFITAPGIVFAGYERTQDSLTSLAAEPVFIINDAKEKISLRVVQGGTDNAVLYFPDVTGATGDSISQLFQYSNSSKATIAIVSYPGYDASEGAPTFENSIEVAEKSYQYLVSKGIKEESITIFGAGFGGVPATYLASKKSSAKKLVLVNTPSSLQSMCFRSFSVFCAFEGSRWNTAEYAKNVEIPTSIYHVRTDRKVPFAEGEYLKKAFEDAKKAKSVQFSPIEGDNATHTYFNIETVLAN